MLSLVVDIVAKTANIEEGLTRVEGRLESFGSVIKGLGAALSVGALAKFTEDILAAGTAMEHAIQISGATSKGFQELAFVASTAGVGVETLAAAMTRMERSMSMAGGGAKLQADALAALGISYKDIKDLKPEDQFTMIGQRITDLQSPMDQARASQAIFGRSFQELVPIFKKTADEMDRLRNEAPILSEEQLKVLEQGHQAFTRLKLVAESLAETLIARLIPHFSDLVDILVRGFGGTKKTQLELDLENINKQLDHLSEVENKGGIRKLLTDLALGPAMQQKGLEARAALTTGAISREDFSAQMEQANKVNIGEFNKQVASQLNVQPPRGYGPQQALDAELKKLTGVKVTVDKIMRGATLDMPAPYAKMFEDLIKPVKGAEGALADLEVQTDSTLKTLDEMLNFKVIKTPMPEDFKNIKAYYEAYKQALAHPQVELKPLITEKDAKELAQTAIDNLETARNKLQSSIDALQPITVKTKKLILIEDMEVAIRNFSQTMENVFATTLHQSGNFGKNLVRNIIQALEDAAIAKAAFALGDMIYQTLMSSASRIGSAGGGGGFVGLLLQGIVGLFGPSGGAAGGKLVPEGSTYGNYAGTGSGGAWGGRRFQHGGSFRVGGSGGIDSSLVAFMASPGEQVQVGGAGAMHFAPVYHIDARGADAERIMTVMPGLLNQAAEKAKRDILVAFQRSGLAAPRAA